MEYEITKVEMKLATNQARGWVEYPANFTTSHGELSELAGVTYEGGTCTGKMQEFKRIDKADKAYQKDIARKEKLKAKQAAAKNSAGG